MKCSALRTDKSIKGEDYAYISILLFDMSYDASLHATGASSNFTKRNDASTIKSFVGQIPIWNAPKSAASVAFESDVFILNASIHLASTFAICLVYAYSCKRFKICTRSTGAGVNLCSGVDEGRFSFDLLKPSSKVLICSPPSVFVGET